MKGGGYITPTTTYAEFRERPLMVAGASRPTAVGRYSSATRGRQRAASRRVASRRLAHPQPRAPGRRSVQFLCAMATALSALGPGVAAAGTNTQGDAMWPTCWGVLDVGGTARVILATPRVQKRPPKKTKISPGGLARSPSEIAFHCQHKGDTRGPDIPTPAQAQGWMQHCTRARDEGPG